MGSPSWPAAGLSPGGLLGSATHTNTLGEHTAATHAETEAKKSSRKASSRSRLLPKRPQPAWPNEPHEYRNSAGSHVQIPVETCSVLPTAIVPVILGRTTRRGSPHTFLVVAYLRSAGSGAPVPADETA